MPKKRVYAHQIETSNYDLLEGLLRGLPTTVTFNTKEVEISHVEENEDFIVGLFVCTQSKELPPQHEPGNPDDYSVVPLSDGKGLAYPSTFLYIKNLHVLLLEQNSGGVTESLLKRILKHHDDNNLRKIKATVSKVLYIDGYERLERSQVISQFKIRILNPINELARREHDLDDIRDLANNAGASKYLELNLSADSNDTLSFRTIRKFIDYVRGNSQGGNVENAGGVESIAQQLTATIRRDNSDGDTIEEAINLLVDRYYGIITLPEQDGNHATVQAEDRKHQISNVYYEYLTRVERFNL